MRLLFCTVLIMASSSVMTKANSPHMTNSQITLKTQYQTIKQPALEKQNIIPADIYPIIEKIKTNAKFNVKLVGHSYLDKLIYKIRFGNGKTKVFMWSQMHGDEPTATGSLFDLINFINAPENKLWVDSWSDKITLHMVPMINPDGADLDQRHNAQSIDINRDAKRLQTPEGQLLNSLADTIKPQYGFNLHDQNRFYTTGASANNATISLLAPAYNDAKDIDDSRKKAMQIIGRLNNSMQLEIPGFVGRYDDTYSYRAFGDLFSSKGIATALIESGHYPDDPNRQVARWMTFLSLYNAINLIADQSFISDDLASYNAIPMNTSNGIVDVLLKDVNINGGYFADISINFDSQFKRGRIREIGDLTTKFGLLTKDMSKYHIEPVKGYQLKELLILDDESYLKLLREGYGYFIGDDSLVDIQTTLPVVINPVNVMNNIPQRYQSANFLFTEQGRLKIIMLEGKLINLDF